MLHHVAVHLQGSELQSLRTSCRALRHSAAILDCVAKVEAPDGHVPETELDLAFLEKLSSLRCLRFHSCPSLFWLYRLSCLQHLQAVQLDWMAIADLMPLCCVSRLRELLLADVQQYLNLGTLTQLSSLRLVYTPCTPQVFDLTSLTRLELNEVDTLAGITALQQLHTLELTHSATLELAPDRAAAMLHDVRQLQGLRALTLGWPAPPAVTSLTQLTALALARHQALLALTPLPSLRFLGLAHSESAVV